MGNGGLTGCSVTAQEAVSVVHPNGYVEYIRKPCNVEDLLLMYPDYFVSRSIIAKNRGLPPGTKLETGQTYFLQPKPGIRPGTQFLRPVSSAQPPVPLTFLQDFRVDSQCSSCGDQTRKSMPAVRTTSYQTSKKGVAETYEAAAAAVLERGWKSKKSAAREIELKQSEQRQMRQPDHHPSLPSYIRASGCLVKFTFFQDCCATLLPIDCNRLLEHPKENRGNNRVSKQEYSTTVPGGRSHPYSRRSSRHRRSRSKSWQPVLQSISETTVVHVSGDTSCCTDAGDVDDSTPHLLSYYVDAARQLEINFEAKCSVYTA